MSEISEYNVKISVINIIKSLIEKVDVIQDKMVTFCIEMKYIKQKKLNSRDKQIKRAVTVIRNTFNKLMPNSTTLTSSTCSTQPKNKKKKNQ